MPPPLRLSPTPVIKEMMAPFIDGIHRTKPHLGIIRNGIWDNSGSYEKRLEEDADHYGITTTDLVIPKSAPVEQVMEEIRAFVSNPRIHGIILMHPLSQQVRSSAAQICALIPGIKDIDGMSGASDIPKEFIGGATAMAFMQLATHYGLITNESYVTMFGQGSVGGPGLKMAKAAGAQGFGIDAKTPREVKIAEAQKATLIVTAMGTPRLDAMVTEEMIGPRVDGKGPAIIEIASHPYKREEKEQLGDELSRARFRGEVRKKAIEMASMHSSVTGGVGPITCAQLIVQTYIAQCMQEGLTPVALPRFWPQQEELRA